MSSLELRVYDLFKKRFSDEEASLVIEYFEAKSEEKIQQKKDLFLTKEDKTDIIKWMFIFWTTQLAAMFAFLKLFTHPA